MRRVDLLPELEKALREGCAALGGHPLQGLLAGRLPLDEKTLDVVRDYVRRIEEHLRAKYPGYDDEEDAYFDALESWRNKFVFLVADAVGDGFLDPAP